MASRGWGRRIVLYALGVVVAVAPVAAAPLPPMPASLTTPVERVIPVRDYTNGPRGGCYYINRNGNKTYVDHSLCGRATPRASAQGYITGPRGGCYYLKGGSKTKVYVDRSRCR